MLGGMSEAALELVANMLGGSDDVTGNPMAQALMGMALAARMPAASTPHFLAGARESRRVTIRVSDPVDNETQTDVFYLDGLDSSLDALDRTCRP